MPAESDGAWAPQLRAALPQVLVLAAALGYLAVVQFSDEVADPVPGDVPPVVHAIAVGLQALALVYRHRSPVAVFGVVTLLDALLLATSGGELGVGALGVVIATYTLVRDGAAGRRLVVVAAGALFSIGVGVVAMAVNGTLPLVGILGLPVARAALQFAVPAAVAEVQVGRSRLVDALRDRELTTQRTAMARELHDIAAHHLSGIIVSAQAASTLVTTDPERTRDMLRVLQQDARTTMADLRRTVGLLRSDDLDEHPDGALRAPALDRVADLVAEARRRGQRVDLDMDGTPRSLGPLAETAGYRMVQESLANVARHAPGAPARVQVVYTEAAVEITVDNDAVPTPTGRADRRPADGRSTDRGYGLSGMEERADLVGATLRVGPRADGGWRNHLTIPYDRDRRSS